MADVINIGGLKAMVDGDAIESLAEEPSDDVTSVSSLLNCTSLEVWF